MTGSGSTNDVSEHPADYLNMVGSRAAPSIVTKRLGRRQENRQNLSFGMSSILNVYELKCKGNQSSMLTQQYLQQRRFGHGSPALDANLHKEKQDYGGVRICLTRDVVDKGTEPKVNNLM